MEAKITCRPVPATVMNRVLKKYRVMGTQELFITVIRSFRLSSVGFCTKNRGGERYSSSIGLNALQTT